MLNTTNTLNWLKHFAELIEQNKAYLSDLDTAIGDGDHGNNMSRGVKAIMAQFESNSFSTVSDIFKNVAMTLMSSVGGASGPLYGSAFLEMAKTAKEQDDLVAIIHSGCEAIKKRGKAVPGEKTMIDVWQPISDALSADTFTQKTIDDAIMSTKDMLATKGRASYLGERSVGHLDPGAVSSGYLFTAMLNELN